MTANIEKRIERLERVRDELRALGLDDALEEVDDEIGYLRSASSSASASLAQYLDALVELEDGLEAKGA